MGSVIIGSATNCDLSLPADDSIAQRHLRIDCHSDADDGQPGFVLESLSSAHPVLVDGQEVRNKRIEPGCVLQIGSELFRFETHGLYPVLPGGVVRVCNLSLKRRKAGANILRRITFDVSPGDLFGIFGPSGCGKSTLMDCLRGELSPTDGWVDILHGTGPSNASLPQTSVVSVGFVPQENLLYDRLTVAENLRTSAVIRMPDEDAQSIEGHVERVLSVIGLNKPEDRNKSGTELSGGMRKRINVALELLSMPQILLLDEPTSGLDPATGSGFMGFLKQLSNRCVTVICVTHALETLDRFDHLLLLRKLSSVDATSMIFRGTPDELRQRFNDEQIVRLFDTNPGSVTTTVVDNPDIDHEPPPTAQRSNVNTATKRPFWPAVSMTFRRAWLSLWRNSLNASMVFALPVILGVLVFLSQAPKGGPDWYDPLGSIILVLTISALWMGMNLSVREIVAERLICSREMKVGLGKLEYLAGKVLYAALFSAAQTMILALVVLLLSYIKPWGLGATDLISPFVRIGFWIGRGALLALWGSAFTGALLGLSVSAFARSQALAVTLIPIFLIPHLLFNRNMAGDGNTVSKVDTYCAVRYVSWPDNVKQQIHLIGSASLISRPVLGLMLSANIYCDNDKASKGNRDVFKKWRRLEWFYLFVVVAGHVLLLQLVFWHFGPGTKCYEPGLRRTNRLKFFGGG